MIRAAPILEKNLSLILNIPLDFRRGFAFASDKMWKQDCSTVVVVSVGLFSPSEALAYIDPGTSGMLSQVLYVMFYGALAVFFYGLRYIKQYVVKVGQSLAKIFGRF